MKHALVVLAFVRGFVACVARLLLSCPSVAADLVSIAVWQLSLNLLK
jgi:hypothetical protein